MNHETKKKTIITWFINLLNANSGFHNLFPVLIFLEPRAPFKLSWHSMDNCLVTKSLNGQENTKSLEIQSLSFSSYLWNLSLVHKEDRRKKKTRERIQILDFKKEKTRIQNLEPWTYSRNGAQFLVQTIPWKHLWNQELTVRSLVQDCRSHDMNRQDVINPWFLVFYTFHLVSR